MRVLVAGARGFIGRALCPALERAGHDVVRGMRPAFDVDDERAVRAALEGADAAVWLVHGLKRSDYVGWETRTATAFAEAARAAGTSRIVYLGGIDPRRNDPQARLSPHFAARLATGDALRSTQIDVVELRAAMIIGAGSESWVLARDGAARLPAFLAPPWLAARSQPVALADVVAALVACVTSTSIKAGVYDAPGPEVLTGRAVVERTLALLGRRAAFIDVPGFPRRVAAFLAPFVTRADAAIARELFRGVGYDLVVEGDGIFALMPGHHRLSFDEAVLQALADDHVPLTARLYEGALRFWRPA